MGVIINPVLTPISAVDAPLISNDATEKALFPPNGKLTVLRGALNDGSTIGLRLFGVFSNKASGPGSLTLRAKLGATQIWTSGALNIPASLHSDLTFWLDLLFMLRAGGASAKVKGAGLLQAILGSQSDFPLPATAPADSATFDCNQDLDLDVTAQFSVADVGNKIQLLGIQPLC